MPDWFDNNELFVKECKDGHRWERYVATFFNLQGLPVALSKQTIREHVSQAKLYKKGSDLRVAGMLMEVKSRNVAWNTPKDFPYDDILVDTVSGWEAKSPVPRVIVCVSRKTSAMMYLPVKATKADWDQVLKHDNVRDIEDNFYVAWKGLWRPIDELVTKLRNHCRAKQIDKMLEDRVTPPETVR